MIAYRKDGDNHVVECNLVFSISRKSKLDAMCDTINLMTENMENVCKVAPVPGVEGLYPAVVYFATNAEREDFYRMVQKIHPNLKPYKM